MSEDAPLDAVEAAAATTDAPTDAPATALPDVVPAGSADGSPPKSPPGLWGFTTSTTSVAQWPAPILPDIKVADLRAANAAEFEAKKRVAELKRQLERERTRYGMQRARHNKLQEAATYRRQLDKLTGRDTSHLIKDKGHAKASEEEVLWMSQFLNKMMVRVFASPTERSWFNLFCRMDDDRTGRITYNELHEYVRRKLELAEYELPDEKLLSVWAALDDDNSGFLTSGEFGRFMRLATRKAAKSWKERHAEAQETRGKLARQATALNSGKAISHALADLAPAEPATVKTISELINAKLTIFPDPQTRTWYMLFKHIDDDATGRISHHEFVGFVREELELDREKLPDAKLNAVWKALDHDGSGFITVAEFGPFMRIGAKAYKHKRYERTPQELFAEKQAALKRRQALELSVAARDASQRIMDRTSSLQREAEELQRALKQTTRARQKLGPSGSAPVLPSLGTMDFRPATSMGLGRGRASGEYNDEKRFVASLQEPL